MIAISDRHLREFTGRFIGQARPVLLEHSAKEGSMSGFTDNYIKVRLDAPASLDNTIVSASLLSIADTHELVEARLNDI